MYGDAYDDSVKALVKASQTHAQMSKQVGIKEVLADISIFALSEKKDDAVDSKKEGNDQLLSFDEASGRDDVIEVTVS